MIGGLRTPLWWQRLVGGRIASPQDLFRAAHSEKMVEGERYSRFLGVPRESGKFEAPRRLAAPGFFHSNTLLLQWERADWQYVDIRLCEWSARLIELARKRNIPLYVHCAFRTRSVQERAVAEGRSKAKWPRSAHNIGEAVDIVHGVFGWEMSPQEWEYIHVLGQEALRLVNEGVRKDRKLELVWGGKFRTLYDPAHWEIADYRQRMREIKEGPPIRRTPRGMLRPDRPVVSNEEATEAHLSALSEKLNGHSARSDRS